MRALPKFARDHAKSIATHRSDWDRSGRDKPEQGGSGDPRPPSLPSAADRPTYQSGLTARRWSAFRILLAAHPA